MRADYNPRMDARPDDTLAPWRDRLTRLAAVALTALLLVEPACALQDGGGAAPVEDVTGVETPVEEAAVDQDATAPSPEEPPPEDPPPAETEPPEPEVTTEAEQLQRLDKGLEADAATLERLVERLAEREALFEEISESDERIAAELQALEDLGEEADPAEVEALRGRLERVKSQADITWQSIKAMRTQRDALVDKMRQDERARDALLGIRPSPAEPVGGATTTAPAAADTSGGAAPAALPVPVPGVPLPSGDAPPPAAPPERKQTTEQIEAQKEAERLEQRATEAEQAVVEFLERKAALEEQIELEQQLLETSIRSRDNLEAALAEREAELDRLITEGADGERLGETRDAIELIRGLAQDARTEVDEHDAQLSQLEERLEGLQGVQLQVSQEAEQRRAEAEEAQRRSVWLKSPLHPRNVAAWAVERGPRILLVIAAAVLAILVIRITLGRVARALIRRGRGDRQGGGNRAHTLASSFRSASTVVITLGAFLLVLQEAGIDIKTVLGGAAILGVAVAFGAQNLMRDYFTGFLILLEDQFEIGDLITIGKITGTVERVNMRTTMLRDLEGRMHFIPNGEIKAVTNRTYVWGRAVLEIPVRFDEDVDRVMDVILEVAAALRQDPEWADAVVEDAQMLGVDKFTEAGVVIKFMVRTAPDRMFPVRRELLRRIKNRFDAEGIRISAPHRVVVGSAGGDASEG